MRFEAGVKGCGMDESDDKATLGGLLRRLVETLDADVEASYVAAGLDFRPRFTPVLRALLTGPKTIKAIAAQALISHSAASQTISQMIDGGWLIRATGEDGRERLLSLSPHALKHLPLLEKRWAATASAVADLDAELGVCLTEVARRALAALARKSFRDRMSR